MQRRLPGEGCTLSICRFTASVLLSAVAAITLIAGCGGGTRSPGVARDDGMISVATQSLTLTDASGRDTGRTVSSPALLVRPGDEFSLPVSVSDMAGVAGIALRLDFDRSVFACVDVAPGAWAAASEPQARNVARSSIAVASVTGAPSGSGVVATYRMRALASARPRATTLAFSAAFADAHGETIGGAPRSATLSAPRRSGTVAPQSSTLIGDLDGTGTADVGSAIKILRVVVGLDNGPDAGSLWQWDCNKNGVVDVGDAVAILRCVVALDPWPIFQITEQQGPDGQVMVWVPPGEFDMGSDAYGTDEKPVRHIKITKGFWIGKFSVTAQLYTHYMQVAGSANGSNFASYTNDNDTYPYINAQWTDAVKYCQWAGMRLPTEAEWEYAARGTTGFIYPWGNTWDPSKCCNGSNNGPEHIHYQHTLPVGSFPTDKSWCGMMDVAGNAANWCQDWYIYPYLASDLIDPTGPATGTEKVIRGGGWSGDYNYCRLTHRYSAGTNGVMLDWVGFRCVQSGP